MADLKLVYAAPTEEIALAELDSFDEKWSGKYPKIANHGKITGQICQLILNIRKQSDA